MLNKKLMILVIFLVLLLAVSAVNATDNATEDVVNMDNTTDEVVSLDDDTNDVVSVEDNNQIIGSDNGEIDDLSANPDGTFTDLANEIANATGELRLTKNYVYDSSKDYNYKNGIEINKELTINGKGFTINGNNNARAFNVLFDNVILMNIEFINGFNLKGGAVCWSGGEGVLYNCSFVNCSSSSDDVKAYGGAVYWSGGEGVLYNCNFLNSFSSSNGGAVYWSGSDGNLYNCSFVNSSSLSYYFTTSGTAICWYGYNGTLFNCTFMNSTANYYHQNVYGRSVSWYGDDGTVFGCIFNNPYFTKNVHDRVVYWKGNGGSLYNCSFMNSPQTIYWEGTNGILFNSTFLNSSSYAHGSGCAIEWQGSKGVLLNCTFINSAAYNGGAVVWYADKGTVSNCEFINSSASNRGGALYWSGLQGVLNNCTFTNSHVKSYDNAIYWDGLNGKILDSYFSPSSNTITNAANLQIIKRNSSLSCENISFVYSNKVNLSAYLNHDGRLIFHMINEEGIKKTFILNTNNKIATLNEELNELDAGLWNITVIFNEDDNYYSCNATAQIIIHQSYSSLNIDDVNATVGHEVTLVANVNSIEPINESVVTFFDGEINIGKANVIDGVATLVYTPTTAGEHPITAIFNSTNYLSSNSTAKLLADSATVEVLVNSSTVGFESSFIANVKGLYSTINEGVVEFYVEDDLIGFVPVVDGSATVSYTPLVAKNYNIRAVFTDSDKFLDDESTAVYVVGLADSEILIDDMNGAVGHELTITVNIVSSNNLTINEGYIIFFDGSTQIGEKNVINGEAKLTYTPTTAGEHPITAMFYSTNYGDPINSALLNVSKANIDLSINNIATVYFSNPSAFNVNVYSNSKGVNEGNIKYYVNGNYIDISNVYAGQSSTNYATNTTGSFELFVVYDETDNYYAKTASTIFLVNKMPTTLTGESVIFDEEQSKTFTTELKDNNNDGVDGQTVKIETIKYSGESATFTGVTDGNGVVIYDVSNLAGGMWYVAGTYKGNNGYIESKFTDKFIVVRIDTTTAIEGISNPYVNHTYKLKANIHDENGKLVKEGIVQFYLDGVDIGSIDLSKNQGHQSALREGVLGAVNPMFEDVLGANDNTDLYIDYVPTKAGKHTLTAVYGGTTIYKASNQTTTFNVQGGAMPTTITASDVSAAYNGGQYLIATLKDVSKQPVGGVIVSIKLSNGKVYSNLKTDANGQVKVSTNGLAPKTYTAIITFAGNTNFAKSTKSVKITVKKATPKLTVAKKTFKKSVKTKKYTVTLKDNNGKVMAKVKLTLKIKGKTYKVKTNAKGKAVFKIKKLTKKGTFKAQVKFAGNTYYNAVTKTVKITIK